jgi:hypothetical protein
MSVADMRAEVAANDEPSPSPESGLSSPAYFVPLACALVRGAACALVRGARRQFSVQNWREESSNGCCYRSPPGQEWRLPAA